MSRRLQVRESTGWRDVTAPHRWSSDYLIVDWPGDACDESVSYPVERVRQKPGTVDDDAEVRG